jgi:hypothetical protein
LPIKALRAKAEQALDPDFDIRAFHDVVVGNGSLAIAILEEIVDEWIAEKLNQAVGRPPRLFLYPRPGTRVAGALAHPHDQRRKRLLDRYLTHQVLAGNLAHTGVVFLGVIGGFFI